MYFLQQQQQQHLFCQSAGKPEGQAGKPEGQKPIKAGNHTQSY